MTFCGKSAFSRGNRDNDFIVTECFLTSYGRDIATVAFRSYGDVVCDVFTSVLFCNTPCNAPIHEFVGCLDGKDGCSKGYGCRMTGVCRSRCVCRKCKYGRHFIYLTFKHIFAITRCNRRVGVVLFHLLNYKPQRCTNACKKDYDCHKCRNPFDIVFLFLIHINPPCFLKEIRLYFKPYSVTLIYLISILSNALSDDLNG